MLTPCEPGIRVFPSSLVSLWRGVVEGRPAGPLLPLTPFLGAVAWQWWEVGLMGGEEFPTMTLPVCGLGASG